MGKFDGILLLSDWDGTFAYHGEVPEENVRAVKYFEENGGLFSLASGRNFSHLSSFFTDFRPNAPICCYNGAKIVSADGKETYFCNPSGDEMFSAVGRGLSFGKIDDLWLVFTEEDGGHTEFSRARFYENLPSFRGKKTYKAILVADTPEDAVSVMRAFNEREKDDPLGFFAVRSWDVGVEILRRENNKGRAVERIRQLTGAKHTIGAGDFENDYDLLKSADIGYAVEGCTADLLTVADRIGRRFDRGVIAGIVEDLDKEFA